MSDEHYDEVIPTFRRLNDPTSMRGVPLNAWFAGVLLLFGGFLLVRFTPIPTVAVLAVVGSAIPPVVGAVWFSGTVAIGPIALAFAAVRGMFAVLRGRKDPVYGAPVKAPRGGLVMDRVPAAAAAPTVPALPDWHDPENEEQS